MGIRQQNSGNGGTGTSFAVTLPQAALPTSRIVVVIGGNTVITPPAGGAWSSRSEQVNNAGHYVFDRASDSASSWTFTTNAGHRSWHVYEVDNGAFDVSAGANTGGSTTNAIPAITPTAGERVLIAAATALRQALDAVTLSGWTNGFTEQFETTTNNGVSELVTVGSATLSVTANGSTAYSTSVTQSVTADPYGILAAYSTSATQIPTTQTAAPASDITTTGWTTQSGGTANLYSTLDEAAADDSDYVRSPASPTSSPIEVKLVGLIDPQDDTGHTINYRFRSSGTSSSVVVGLYQGTTLIASQTVTTNPSAFTTGNFMLSTGQAAAITDYTDLRIRVTATAA